MKLREEALDAIRNNRGFKAHALTAIIFSGMCFALWLSVSLFLPHYCWPIYVLSIFATTLSFHFTLFVKKDDSQSKRWLNFHSSFFVIGNSMVFLTWLLTESVFSWWLMISLSWGMLLSLHYHLVAHEPAHRLIDLHYSEFILLNVLLFFVWEETKVPGTINWFIIPFFALALPLVIHHCMHYNPGNGFKLHMFVYVDVQLLFFFTWAVTGAGFPWFFFPLLAGTVLLATHFSLKRRAEYQRAVLPQQVDIATIREQPPLNQPYYPLGPSYTAPSPSASQAAMVPEPAITSAIGHYPEVTKPAEPTKIFEPIIPPSQPISSQAETEPQLLPATNKGLFTPPVLLNTPTAPTPIAGGGPPRR